METQEHTKSMLSMDLRNLQLFAEEGNEAGDNVENDSTVKDDIVQEEQESTWKAPASQSE